MGNTLLSQLCSEVIKNEVFLFSLQPDVLTCHVVQCILSSSFHGTKQVRMSLLHAPLFKGSVGKDAEQLRRLAAVSKPSPASMAAERVQSLAATTLGAI